MTISLVIFIYIKFKLSKNILGEVSFMVVPYFTIFSKNCSVAIINTLTIYFKLTSNIDRLSQFIEKNLSLFIYMPNYPIFLQSNTPIPFQGGYEQLSLKCATNNMLFYEHLLILHILRYARLRKVY